jgi:hypothetical protein
VLRTRNNLAIVYLDAGRAQDAIALLEPLLADFDRILGAEHPDTVGARKNLANALEAVGRGSEAERARERAAQESAWGEDLGPGADNTFIV